MAAEQASTTAPDTAAERLTVDQLAARTGLPVRTIREYQTMRLLHPPRRQGRIGLYDTSHVRRLQLIARLQERGYSLAGIADLLAAWRDGAALPEVLGLEPDQLVHVDEPGAPATADQLAELLPQLVPAREAELLATGVVMACGPDRYCVPSPSLLQLTVDVLAAGLSPDDTLELLATFGTAADAVTNATLAAFAALPPDADAAAVDALVERGRGLLAHGLGRLTIHRIGRAVPIDPEHPPASTVDRLAQRAAGPGSQRGDRASEQDPR